MYGIVQRLIGGPHKLAAAGLATTAVMAGVNMDKLNTIATVKTVPGGEVLPAKSLWAEHGAVVQIVRRPG